MGLMSEYNQFSVPLLLSVFKYFSTVTTIYCQGSEVDLMESLEETEGG